MKKLKVLITFLCLMVGISIMAAPAGATLLIYGENVLYYNNFETVFDSSGNEIEFTPGGTPPDLDVGDHFVGIINVQNIDSLPGTTHWYSSGTDQVTGIFAQRVEAIYAPYTDPYDSTNAQTHMLLSTPTISQFTTLTGETFNTGLSGGEMMAMYHDVGGTAFESNGSIVNDVAKAVDGTKWFSFGDGGPGPDGLYETGDEPTYAYSHTNMGSPVENFTGETWAGLNVIYQDDTSLEFPGVNDPNENEWDLFVGPGLLTDMYMSGELEGNPAFTATGGPYSPWVFRSEDPAHLDAVPEPATMFLLGSGLVGLAGFARRKVKKLS